MCPLPSPPKDIQHGGQCSWQSSLDGSSPLQQDLSCFNKLICQTFQRQKTRPSGNSVATDRNAACGFHTLAVWTTQQEAAFRPNPKLLLRSGAGKTHHSTSIPSSQRAPVRGCLFLAAIHHHRKHFRKRLPLFCQRLPTVLDWPLGNDEKNKVSGLEAGKKDLN